MLARPGVRAFMAETPDITHDHLRAIYLYTTDAIYPMLNAELRSSNRGLLKEHFFPYLRLLLEAIALLPRMDNQHLYRGVQKDLVSQ